MNAISIGKNSIGFGMIAEMPEDDSSLAKAKEGVNKQVKTDNANIRAAPRKSAKLVLLATLMFAILVIS